MMTAACDIGSAPRAMASARSKSSRHPARPSAHRAVPRDANAHRQRRTENDVPYGGVAVGQVDDGLRPAQRLGHLAGLRLGADRREGQLDSQGRLADRLDQRHGFGGQPRRLAHPAMAMCSSASPAMPMASDGLSPAAVQSSRSSSKRPPEMSA